MEFSSLEELYEKYPFQNRYFYIAHLLDRVLLGVKDDKTYSELKQAIKYGELIELHLFNEEQEIFIAREGEKIWVYKPLFHKKEQESKDVIDRCYEIDLRFSKSRYKWLEVKEYVAYDVSSNMAYVEKTGLYRLLEG